VARITRAKRLRTRAALGFPSTADAGCKCNLVEKPLLLNGILKSH